MESHSRKAERRVTSVNCVIQIQPFDRPASRETERCKQANSTQIEIKNVILLILERFRPIPDLFRAETTIFRAFGTVPDFWAQSPESPEIPDAFRDFGGLVHLC